MKGLLEKRTWWDRVWCSVFGHGPPLMGICWNCGKDLTSD